MKQFRFDDSNPVTVLSFMGQFKRSYDFDGVYEGAAMRLLPFFMDEYPAASLTVCVTPRIDVDAPAIVHREVEGYVRIYAQVEAVNYLLNSYATDDVIKKAASDIELFKKVFIQTSIQFLEALKNEALRIGDA